mmetsp:Transcript_46904/g.147005  ORF Transcript_46904/g.147005 Transcript_46904/m.147005 type:complete len:222 (+) Transcript_46904:156-821(+)
MMATQPSCTRRLRNFKVVSGWEGRSSGSPMLLQGRRLILILIPSSRQGLKNSTRSLACFSLSLIPSTSVISMRGISFLSLAKITSMNASRKATAVCVWVGTSRFLTSSSAACRDQAILVGHWASFLMASGLGPTVEMVTALGWMRKASCKVSISIARCTSLKLFRGSPIPMKTIDTFAGRFSSRITRSPWNTCMRISSASSWPRSPSLPVAQKTHPRAQPT